jgi:hypothetical protein
MFCHAVGGWLMHAKDIAAILGTTVVVITALLGAGSWWFNNFVAKELDGVKSQLRQEIAQVEAELTKVKCFTENGYNRTQTNLDIKIAQDNLYRNITQMLQLRDIKGNGRNDETVNVLLGDTEKQVKDLPIVIAGLQSTAASLVDQMKGCGQ